MTIDKFPDANWFLDRNEAGMWGLGIGPRKVVLLGANLGRVIVTNGGLYGVGYVARFETIIYFSTLQCVYWLFGKMFLEYCTGKFPAIFGKFPEISGNISRTLQVIKSIIFI